MGAVPGINVNCNIPLDWLIQECFPREGAPQRQTTSGLQFNWDRLKAKRDDVLMKMDESPFKVPTEETKQWLLGVMKLEKGQIETFLKNNSRATDNTQESANNSGATDNTQDESGQTRPPEQEIQNGECFCDINRICLSKNIYLWDKKVLNLLNHIPTDILEMRLLDRRQRLSVGPTTGMQSMIDKVWSHVKDEHVRLIGLYGMGGVGKTTLLIQVNNKLCDSTPELFKLQLWIVVSKSPNLVDIQNYIGERIGLYGDDWKIKSQDEKASDICTVFHNKKYKYILLLDDIWKLLTFSDIGIPLPNSENKSKVIFTTRSMQVCGQMGAMAIQVKCLNEADAWTLFQEKVGETTLNAHPDIRGLATDVMRECSGLPLALTIIGQAMNSKSAVPDWNHAFQLLQSHDENFPTITDEVYTRLKRSYDNLTNDSIKSCLLSCSLYAKNQEIGKSDLVNKWIDEKILGRFNDRDKDRNEGLSYINTLVHASLLEECSDETVRMHNVARNMAIWIKLKRDELNGVTQRPNDGDSILNNSFRRVSDVIVSTSKRFREFVAGGDN